MTNEQIILNNRILLMKAGVLKPTGKTMMVDTEEGKCEMAEPEDIHTYAGWKKLGRIVKPGQKAIAKFPIWKYEKKAPEEGNDTERERMFKAEASWFKYDQTETFSG